MPQREEMDEPLAAVRLICRGYPRLATAPIARPSIDAFLFGGGTQWSLESASKRGFVRLLDRLRKFEHQGLNQQFHARRLNKAIRSALNNGYDAQVVKWWFRCYIPGQQLCSLAFVFELAIQHGRLPVLEWLHQETQGRFPELPHLVRCFNPQAIYWLHDHGGRDLPVKLWPLRSAKGGCEFIKWCVKHGDAYKGYIYTPDEAFNCAAESDLETMQQLLEYWPELCTPDSLDLLVRQGNFETVKWLHGSRPSDYFSDLRQNTTGCHIKHRLGLEEARWIVFEIVWKSQAKRLAWVDGIVWYAVRAGDVALLEAITDIRKAIAPACGDVPDSQEPWYSQIGINLMDEAALHGHVAIAQWLLDRQYQSCTTKAMDSAAAVGHLDVIKWLHDHQAQGCTSNAMDDAAAGGHLEVVQWLHQKRQEGCTSRAMDLAASGGFLEVVQWLHVNRSEGCTTDAMDLAARNGKLQVVQWLHEHRTEGSTTSAMDGAAWNGHIDVLKFLHSHRHEGCTEFAMAHAARTGHFQIFKWLHENRSEGCSEEALEIDHYEILDFMARSTTYFSLNQINETLERRAFR